MVLGSNPFRRGLLTASTAALVSILVACGSQGSVELADVQVEPDALTLLLGDDAGQDALVSVGAGLAGPVELTASDVPDGVTVTFDPVEVEPGGSSTLTVVADASAAEGNAELTVHADDGATSASAGLALTVEGLQVDGLLTDFADQPLAGLSVSVEGATVTSDAEGRFSFSGVAVPYDLTVFDVVDQWVHQVQGVRTDSPELRPFVLMVDGEGLPYSATVTGDLSSPVAAEQVVHLCIEGSDRSVSGCTEVEAGETHYEIDAEWGGTASADVTIRAVVYDIASGPLATGVAATGAAQTTLANGNTQAGVDITPESPADATSYDVVVTPPSGFSLQVGGVVTNLAGGLSSISAPDDDPGANSFSLVAPDFPGAEHAVIAQAGAGQYVAVGWVGGLADGGGVDIEFPEAPALLRPIEDAVDVTVETAFAIDAPNDHVNSFIISATGGPDIAITTIEESATLPDLAALDPTLQLAPGTYAWSVMSASVEGGADVVGTVSGDPGATYMSLVMGVNLGYGHGPAGSGTFFFAPSREFTLN